MNRTVAGLIGLILVAGSCSSSTSTDGPLTVQIAGEQEEVAVYEALVTAFENDNPGVDVRLIPVADKGDHITKLTTSFAAGDPPDVFLVNFREYSQFVTRGAIDPFATHLNDAGVDPADYYPQPIEAFTFDGTLQCMPQNISSLVVYYNRALFEASGVPEPEPGWSWEEFRQAAIELTSNGVRGLGIDPNIIRIAPFIWSNGGDIVDDLDSPTRFTLDEPAAREALEFIVSLVRDDRVVPTEEELAATDLETRFVTGELGMILSSRKDTPVFREVLGLDWDVAPLPVAIEPAGILHSDAYCIAAGSERTDLAVDFVSFAIGPQGQTITALGGRTVPSLISVSQSGAFLDPTRPPSRSQVFLDGVPVIRRTPVIPTWPEIEDITKEILTRAFYEHGYTIDDAIRDLREQTQDLFEEGAPE